MRTPDKDRKAAERERKRALGLVKVEVWVRPKDVQAVRKYEQRLRKRAASEPGAGP